MLRHAIVSHGVLSSLVSNKLNLFNYRYFSSSLWLQGMKKVHTIGGSRMWDHTAEWVTSCITQDICKRMKASVSLELVKQLLLYYLRLNSQKQNFQDRSINILKILSLGSQLQVKYTKNTQRQFILTCDLDFNFTSSNTIYFTNFRSPVPSVTEYEIKYINVKCS